MDTNYCDPLHDISASEPEVVGGGALSSGAVAGIVLGALAATILVITASLIIGFLVFKVSKSKESQVSHSRH